MVLLLITEIKFSSPLVTSILDKTGGFLENGPLATAAALTVNVGKAFMDDGNGGFGDGQLR